MTWKNKPKDQSGLDGFASHMIDQDSERKILQIFQFWCGWYTFDQTGDEISPRCAKIGLESGLAVLKKEIIQIKKLCPDKVMLSTIQPYFVVKKTKGTIK